MRDERERFRKFPVFQPSRSRVQFYTMKCMSQRDSKGATLSKAAQDQSEDKPLPVALMLAQVRCAEGVSKTSLDSIHPRTNNGPLAKVNTLQHVPEKVVQTIAEPCSQILKMCLLPQFEAAPLEMI